MSLIKEGELPESIFLLDDPRAMDELANQIYQVTTEELASDPSHWAYERTSGTPITARTEDLCNYVHGMAQSLLQEQLGNQGQVEYYEYAEAYWKNYGITPMDKRNPRHSFLVVRTTQSYYLVDFQYLQLTTPSPLMQDPNCMVIKFSSKEDLEKGLEKHRIDPAYRHYYTNLFGPPDKTFSYQDANRYPKRLSPLTRH